MMFVFIVCVCQTINKDITYLLTYLIELTLYLWHMPEDATEGVAEHSSRPVTINQFACPSYSSYVQLKKRTSFIAYLFVSNKYKGANVSVLKVPHMQWRIQDFIKGCHIFASHYSAYTRGRANQVFQYLLMMKKFSLPNGGHGPIPLPQFAAGHMTFILNFWISLFYQNIGTFDYDMIFYGKKILKLIPMLVKNEFYEQYFADGYLL